MLCSPNFDGGGGDVTPTVSLNCFLFLSLGTSHLQCLCTASCFVLQFSLAIDSLPEVLSETKKVFNGVLTVGQCVCVEMSLRTVDGESMVLETWSLSMTEPTETSWRGYPTIYNKMCTLLKSLICITRVTPGYRLSRKQGAETYVICYRIYTGSAQTQHLGMRFQTRNVGAVSTPLGAVRVALDFRTKMLMSPQVSRDLTADLKDDHFCTDASPQQPQLRATPSKPCPHSSRDSRYEHLICVSNGTLAFPAQLESRCKLLLSAPYV